MSVAELQRHLHVSGIDQIEVASYLTKLCDSLASPMIGESQPLAIKVIADEGRIGSDKAVGLGLIVTELVINAIKYAFPVAKADAVILVTYVRGSDWQRIVSDNGLGKQVDGAVETSGGLGTVIVQALAKQLDARVDVVGNSTGTSESVTRATFTSQLPRRCKLL
jgi:chemotaxis protein methyltransferase CheR